MLITNLRPAAALFAMFGACALVAGTASAKTLVMATDRAGTLYNATGSGIAKVLTANSKHRVVVRAFGGPDAYMQALNSGEYDFTAISSNSAWFNYNGKTRSKKKARNLRILRSGAGALRLGFVVYADSSIKTVADLKGRRITSDFGGHAAINPIVTATLAVNGLTWKDVKPVPVTGALDSPRALGADRVEAAWASLGMPVVREIHAKKKVRYLGIDGSAKTLAALRRMVFPGIRLTKMPPLKHLGLPAPTTLITGDSYLVTHKGADPAILKAVLNALWDNTKPLRKAHFSLRGFSNKTAATDLPMLPYHPVAIEFYRAKGVWTKAMEAANAKLK
ncbi:MAG: TAXI family TRAP transporter solute-binding subunit [Alphaproteobacteria bacterium]